MRPSERNTAILKKFQDGCNKTRKITITEIINYFFKSFDISYCTKKHESRQNFKFLGITRTFLIKIYNKSSF
jgi:hypothetical protein